MDPKDKMRVKGYFEVQGESRAYTDEKGGDRYQHSTLERVFHNRLTCFSILVSMCLLEGFLRHLMRFYSLSSYD